MLGTGDIGVGDLVWCRPNAVFRVSEMRKVSEGGNTILQLIDGNGEAFYYKACRKLADPNLGNRLNEGVVGVLTPEQLRNDSNPLGKRVSGTFYRYGDINVPHGVSVWEIMKYEVDELGNDPSFFLFNSKLKRVSGQMATWVTTTPTDAARFNMDNDIDNLEPEEWDTSDVDEFRIENGWVVGRDDDHGFLIVEL